MPNLIHSLDAASLALIVNIIADDKNINKKVFNFFSIHDCFAVTTNNVSDLIKIVKLVYIKIYSDENYLKKFDQGIIDNIKRHFGAESFNDEDKTIKVNGYNLNYPDVNKILTGKIDPIKLNNKGSSLN
jgi:DNA-directed RNA polymerase